ncbi:hypothetical protein OG946_33465 [Streptomyces sp. NBC_01808]|uniref:hypothetical protein n=1 Tax=Streptomyces sp. NBC_01808 TaxID=2975947 RepID=UPI002DD83975|nr:hypothetical protein [Streptomyces sp. NBC_01808]WSA41856.1 hypothetical protein OG946_33465 [Streptomyces sp. NBC_01808]
MPTLYDAGVPAAPDVPEVPAAAAGSAASAGPLTAPSRRRVLRGLTATAGAAGLAALGAGPAPAAGGRGGPGRPLRVLVATNEPWGTYHVKPLLAEAARRGVRITQLVPDTSGVQPGDPVPVTTPQAAPRADLLVVTGAGDWPLECVARFPRLPVAAGSLAYLGPQQAPGAGLLRPRLRAVTSSSPAEARAFGSYLGVRRRIRAVGSPQTDTLPEHRPEPGLVLVLTSVTHPDGTGGAAPGTELLLAAAEKLRAAGKRILVGLHPRENPKLWDAYEISDVPSLQASARAEAAVGIPGTVFPLVAAVGVPLVGVTGAGLTVPDYLLAVCSSTIDDPAEAVPAVTSARLPAPDVLADAVGPIGGSAARLLDVWRHTAHPGHPHDKR